MNAQLIFPAPRPPVANDQPAFPDPALLQFNTPKPSASRNQTVRLLASKVRMIPEPIAIAASKACRQSPTPRQFLIQHHLRDRHRQCPPAVAVVVASAMAVIEVVVASVNFLFL
jgi:hypothetical protein